MSFGGNAKKESSRSESYGYDLSGSQQNTTINASQMPFLQQLWQQAQSLSNLQGTGGQQALANSLVNQGQGLMGNLQGMSDPQALIDAQTASLKSGLSDMFNQGTNRIGDQADAVGAYGGARHGAYEANLGGEIAKAFTQGHGDIVGNARQQAIGANLGGLGNLGNIFNLGLGGMQSQWAPLMQLGNLLGGPVMDSSGSSFGMGENASMSESSSKSGGFSFGFGL